jgi:hypothetical protein
MAVVHVSTPSLLPRERLSVGSSRPVLPRQLGSDGMEAPRLRGRKRKKMMWHRTYRTHNFRSDKTTLETVLEKQNS